MLDKENCNHEWHWDARELIQGGKEFYLCRICGWKVYGPNPAGTVHKWNLPIHEIGELNGST